MNKEWYFSDVLLAGIGAKTIVDLIPVTESLPATPQTKPIASSSAPGKSQEEVVSKLPIFRVIRCFLLLEQIADSCL